MVKKKEENTMYDEKMVVKIEMFFDVDNNEDYQELKTVEHHADRKTSA